MTLAQSLVCVGEEHSVSNKFFSSEVVTEVKLTFSIDVVHVVFLLSNFILKTAIGQTRNQVLQSTHKYLLLQTTADWSRSVETIVTSAVIH